jgi:hypothetical protein
LWNTADGSLHRAGIGAGSAQRQPALKRLVLDGNDIRGRGLTSLKEQPELIDLALGCPTLGDLFANNQAELKQVKRLSLAGSGLTDAGINHRAGLPSLEWLDLRRTKASAAGVAELQNALPNCKIDWDGMKDRDRVAAGGSAERWRAFVPGDP